MAEFSPLPPAHISREQLGKRVLRTFRTSFKLSQGLYGYQSRLQDLASVVYNDKYDAGAIQEAVATIPDAAVVGLLLPRGHKNVFEPENTIENTFTDQWKTFLRKVRAPEYTVNDALFEEDVAMSMFEIADRDYKYLGGETARPATAPRVDPRRSFFRDYVLGAKLTGDPEVYDTVLAKGREILREPHRVRSNMAARAMRNVYMGIVPEVAIAWERHHPGQSFIDPTEYKDTLVQAYANAAIVSGRVSRSFSYDPNL